MNGLDEAQLLPSPVEEAMVRLHRELFSSTKILFAGTAKSLKSQPADGSFSFPQKVVSSATVMLRDLAWEVFRAFLLTQKGGDPAI